jgi:GAF domain-containing protein
MGITVFSPAPVPANEFQRRAAVLASGVLDQRESAGLTALAKEAQARLSAHWAAIVMIVDDWQHVVASSGGMLGPHRRSTSISTYTIVQPGAPFLILDATRDPRFRGNPFVEDRLIAFYAGASIVDRNGYPLGALCVTDRTPRATFDIGQQTILTELADRVLPVAAAGLRAAQPDDPPGRTFDAA